MKVILELYSAARYLTNIKEIEIDLKEEACLRDLVVYLINKFPQLLGRVIHTKTHKIVETFKFNINGKHMVNDLDFKLHEGDRILLFPIDGGG